MNDQQPSDDIAHRLRSARAEIFRTAADAARALGMKPVTVRAHENGQNKPGYYDLERYARRYGVDVAWLMSGKGESAPTVAVHQQFGEPLAIYSLVEDHAWIAMDNPDAFPTREPLTSDGEPEFAIYSDPRFPAEMVTAWKIKNSWADSPYPENSVIFTLPRWDIGYRPGDHVVVVVKRGDFCLYTLRSVRMDGAVPVFDPLISVGLRMPLRMDNVDDGEALEVLGVVIGAVIRRDVPQLSIQSRIAGEMFPNLVREPTPPSSEKS